jgi:hypothetical protein
VRVNIEEKKFEIALPYRECAGDGEEDDFLSLPFFLDIKLGG